MHLMTMYNCQDVLKVDIMVVRSRILQSCRVFCYSQQNIVRKDMRAYDVCQQMKYIPFFNYR